jgi:hypothetical protein
MTMVGKQTSAHIAPQCCFAGGRKFSARPLLTLNIALKQDVNLFKMLSVFLHTHILRRPAEHDIGNFCAMVENELDGDPNLSAQVTQITHYKEKVGLC